MQGRKRQEGGPDREGLVVGPVRVDHTVVWDLLVVVRELLLGPGCTAYQGTTRALNSGPATKVPTGVAVMLGLGSVWLQNCVSSRSLHKSHPDPRFSESLEFVKAFGACGSSGVSNCSIQN